MRREGLDLMSFLFSFYCMFTVIGLERLNETWDLLMLLPGHNTCARTHARSHSHTQYHILSDNPTVADCCVTNLYCGGQRWERCKFDPGLTHVTGQKHWPAEGNGESIATKWWWYLQLFSASCRGERKWSLTTLTWFVEETWQIIYDMSSPFFISGKIIRKV